MAHPKDNAPDLLIVVATETEVIPFLDAVGETSRLRLSSGTDVIRGKRGVAVFDLIITGPGVVNTAMAMGDYLATHRPPLIVDTGIAGFFPGTGLALGDIAIATAEICVHSGVESTHPPMIPDPLPFSPTGAPCQGADGQLAFHPVLVRRAAKLIHGYSSQPFPLKEKVTPAGNGPCRDRGRIFKPSRPVCGPFITVSTITATKNRTATLSSAFSPVMEAMEGSAAVHTAARYHLPILEIRAASNPVGERSRDNWNIPSAVTAIRLALLALMDQGDDLWNTIPRAHNA